MVREASWGRRRHQMLQAVGQQTLNSINLFILKLLFIKRKICTVSWGSCCLSRVAFVVVLVCFCVAFAVVVVACLLIPRGLGL